MRRPTSRRWIAALLLAGLAASAAPAAAGTETGAAAEALVAEAERTLTALGRAEGTFELRAPGGVAAGRFVLDRTAGRLRVEIGQPLGHTVVADGPVLHFATDGGTLVRTATADTPIAPLFAERVDLARDFVIEQVDTRGDTEVSIALAERGDAESRVLLRFRRDPDWRLAGWGLFTPAGYSSGRIVEMATGGTIDPAAFTPPEEPAALPATGD